MELPLHLMKYYVFMIPVTKTWPADMECGLSEKLAEAAAYNYYSVQYEIRLTLHDVLYEALLIFRCGSCCTHTKALTVAL